MAVLLLLLLLTTAAEVSGAAPPSHNHHHNHHRRRSPPTRSPPPPPSRSPQQRQLDDVISALTSTSDFRTWAEILLSSSPPIPGVRTTLFVPPDEALSHLPTWFDPLLVPYHVIPDYLDFSQLRRLPTLSRLPTLLPDHYLLLTNTSASNFTVDDSLITRPDLFLSQNFAVHGIRNVLQYSLYRDAHEANGTVDTDFLPPPLSAPPREEVGYGLGSGDTAAVEFRIVFLLVFVSALAINP